MLAFQNNSSIDYFKTGLLIKPGNEILTTENGAHA